MSMVNNRAVFSKAQCFVYLGSCLDFMSTLEQWQGSARSMTSKQCNGFKARSYIETRSAEPFMPR